MKVSFIDLFFTACISIMLSIVGCAVVDIVKSNSTQQPQRYTVRFQDTEYQDLQRIGYNNHYSVYRTKEGKRVEFHGTFSEIEQ
jgi:hypothetical protein